MSVNQQWIAGYDSLSKSNEVYRRKPPLTPEQIEIRELKKRIANLEEHNEILKVYCSLDVGLTEQFSMIEKLRKSFSVKTLCHVFSVHRSSYKNWRFRDKQLSPEQVKLHSILSDMHDASHSSAGARTSADMVTNIEGIPLSRYRASKLGKLLGLVSCQSPKHKYRKAEQEHLEIPNL